MSEPINPRAAANAGAISLHVPRLADFSRSDRRKLISRGVVSDCTRGFDLAAIALSGLILALAYVQDVSVLTSPAYLAAIGGVAGLVMILLDRFGCYRVENLGTIATQLTHVSVAWLNAFAILAAAVFFLKSGEELSRIWIAAWLGTGAFLLIGSRVVLAALVKRWMREGRLFRRAVVYGTGAITEKVLADLEADASNDLRIAGVFDERGEGDRAPAMTLGYPLLGGLDDLISHARSTRVDVVIIGLPMAAEKRLSTVTSELYQLPSEIKMPAGAAPVRLSPGAYSSIGGVRMISLAEKPMSAWGAIAKSAIDRAVAATAIILLAPLLAMIAIAVKLESKGPALFRQKRYGFNNELIEVFKFRSMYTDMCDANASRLVTKEDPRVTRIGKFIRKSSLDELPQLFNVLRGDLSLVGPRPHALSAKAADRLYDEVVDGYFARHKVKPGITGWAQINGWRGETDTADKIQKRVEHDLYYIENWSIALDLYILVRTPLALLKTDNAY